MNLFYTPQIVTAFVCTDNITLGNCTRWIRPEGPRHVEKTSRRWSCAVAERAHGKEHGDAHECSKIYVLKYTECHPLSLVLPPRWPLILYTGTLYACPQDHISKAPVLVVRWVAVPICQVLSAATQRSSPHFRLLRHRKVRNYCEEHVHFSATTQRNASMNGLLDEYSIVFYITCTKILVL